MNTEYQTPSTIDIWLQQNVDDVVDIEYTLYLYQLFCRYRSNALTVQTGPHVYTDVLI